MVDLRDVRGNIFGGDQMTEWTVMSGPSRATFQNPQHALYDRVAAVRTLANELPVEGRVLFTAPRQIPQGAAALDPHGGFTQGGISPPADSEASQNWLERYREDWQTIVAATSPSSLRQRRGFLAEVFDERF